jgi:hypothetical protein
VERVRVQQPAKKPPDVAPAARKSALAVRAATGIENRIFDECASQPSAAVSAVVALPHGGCENCGRGGRMLAARVEQKNGHHMGRRRVGRYSVGSSAGAGRTFRARINLDDYLAH